MLYLAYRGQAKDNLERYAKCCQTENLHPALKTRGFNLEETGVTRAERVSTLLSVVAVAFSWGGRDCLHLGVRDRRNAGDQTTDSFEKTRTPCGCFAWELDHLQDLLAQPSPTSWRELADLVPRFEGWSA